MAAARAGRIRDLRPVRLCNAGEPILSIIAVAGLAPAVGDRLKLAGVRIRVGDGRPVRERGPAQAAQRVLLTDDGRERLER